MGWAALLIFVYFIGMFYLAGEALAYAKENNKKLDKILDLLQNDKNNINIDITDNSRNDLKNITGEINNTNS